MGKGYELGQGVLDGVRDQLEGAHNDIEAAGKSLPAGGDAGVLTGPLDRLLATYASQAAELSVSLKELAGQVDASKKDYDNAESTAQAELRRASGGRD